MHFSYFKKRTPYLFYEICFYCRLCHLHAFISLPENLAAFNPCVLHHSYELLGVVERGQKEGYSIDFLLLCVLNKQTYRPPSSAAPTPNPDAKARVWAK